MPNPEFPPVRELRGVCPDRFRDEIVPAQEPVVLRGAVADWPAVRAGRESPRAMANYLRALDNGAPTDTMIGPPAIGGHFFYNDDLTGYNFERRPLRIGQLGSVSLLTHQCGKLVEPRQTFFVLLFRQF